jgi:hypothetical protein
MGQFSMGTNEGVNSSWGLIPAYTSLSFFLGGVCVCLGAERENHLIMHFSIAVLCDPLLYQASSYKLKPSQNVQ